MVHTRGAYYVVNGSIQTIEYVGNCIIKSYHEVGNFLVVKNSPSISSGSRVSYHPDYLGDNGLL